MRDLHKKQSNGIRRNLVELSLDNSENMWAFCIIDDRSPHAGSQKHGSSSNFAGKMFCHPSFSFEEVRDNKSIEKHHFMMRNDELIQYFFGI